MPSIRVVAEAGAAPPLIVRVAGEVNLAPGASVTLTVDGPVHCWPRPPAGTGASPPVAVLAVDSVEC